MIYSCLFKKKKNLLIEVSNIIYKNKESKVLKILENEVAFNSKKDRFKTYIFNNPTMLRMIYSCYFVILTL